MSLLPADARVGRVTLRVNDLDRLADFYARVVGLHVQERTPDRAVLGAGGDPLLVLRADPDAPERGREEAGLFHTAFRVPDRTALGAVVDRVADRWLIDGASDHRVSEALYISDPEENGIEIYRDRPREAWPTTPDGTVEMDTLPLDVEALAAESDGASHVPDATAVGHVHLEVSSTAAAREFYVDGLGFGVRDDWGADALFVAAGDYHHHVGLNTWNECTEPLSGRGLAEWELLVPDEAALAAVRERLTERGVTFDADDGAVVAADPDGIPVRVRVAGQT
ncbi:VOC family protein [Halorarius halobius]|uniref:VOC family protein n=1 Tax=Halorarius halobius TaxID=2962671 RepID=UPI0020CB6C1D|nr:VOC family protein [Halorarius halobius]